MSVLNFGELMIRLTPPDKKRFIQAENFQIIFGGCEANVAVSLAQMGLTSRYVTALPDHAIGDAALAFLKKYGVDVSGVLRSGPRMGLYYLETGADARPSKVIYDRAGSSVSLCDPTLYDWEKLTENVTTLHLSGITPALSENCLIAVKDAIRVAKSKGIRITFDLNYRGKLWTPEKAGEVLSGLISGIDVLIANEEHCRMLFGVKSTDYEGISKEMCEKFGIKTLVLTIRESISSDDNTFSASLWQDGHFCRAATYPLHIVDRVGGGDAFAAGLIYALEKGFDPKHTIEFAAAAGVLKHSIPGDCNLVSADEIQHLVDHGRNGRVQR